MRRFMMKSLNYLLLAIMSVNLLAPTAHAGIAGFKLDGMGVRKPIFAHTGQDPVHRSLGGNSNFNESSKNRKFVDQQPTFDLAFVIVQNTLHGLDWSTVQRSSVIPEQSYDGELFGWNGVQDPVLVSVETTPLGSNSIPAPPAFLLLLSGLVIQRRRT